MIPGRLPSSFYLLSVPALVFMLLAFSSRLWLVVAFTLAALVLPFFVLAQDVRQERYEVVRAEVLEILGETERVIAGTNASATIQTLSIRIFDGERAGEVVEFENEMVTLEPGDIIYLNRLVTINNEEFLIFKEFDRRAELIALGIMFVGLMFWFARWQGVRAIASLALSVAAILFVLVPLLLRGYDPVVMSLLIASVILALALFGTHGFRPHVTIAYVGTMGAVAATCLLAAFWVDALRLSGFGAEASVFLNFATGGRLDFAGLLLGAIIIGILGVLDDVSITQASVVQELRRANPMLGPRELYQRALRVGRDHVSSLVNTLALAYVGVALPLVMFLSTSEAPVGQLFNQEIVAAELVRIIIGSVGIILAVPFTTAAAAWWFARRGVPDEVAHSCHDHLHHNHHG